MHLLFGAPQSVVQVESRPALLAYTVHRNPHAIFSGSNALAVFVDSEVVEAFDARIMLTANKAVIQIAKWRVKVALSVGDYQSIETREASTRVANRTLVRTLTAPSPKCCIEAKLALQTVVGNP